MIAEVVAVAVVKVRSYVARHPVLAAQNVFRFTSGIPVHSNFSGKHVTSKCNPWCFKCICIQLRFIRCF